MEAAPGGAAGREPGRLRIAVTTLSPLEDVEPDAEAVRSVRETAALLTELGHEVVEADPPWRIPGVAEMFTAVAGLGGAIVTYGNAFATNKLFVVIILLALLGVGLSELVRILERRLAAWKETERAS